MTFEEANAKLQDIMDTVTGLFEDSGFNFVLSIESENKQFGAQDSNVDIDAAEELTRRAFESVRQGMSLEAAQGKH